jgi:hypothetical protein
MDDSRLKKGILEGDEECLSILVDYYAPRLVAYIEEIREELRRRGEFELL